MIGKLLLISDCKASPLFDVLKTTAFHWRHKVMEAMKRYALQAPLKEEIQIDETYIILNMKGMKSLPRKAKKRKKSSEKRGVNNEDVCVLTAIDSNDQLLLEVIDQGNPKTENIIDTLDGRIQMNQTIITDSKSAYIEVAKKFKATLHQIPSGFHRNGQYHLGSAQSSENAAQ